MSSPWQMSSQDRQEMKRRSRERRLTDKDHDILEAILDGGLDSMEKLKRRERNRGVDSKGPTSDKDHEERSNKQSRSSKKRKGHGRISSNDYTGATTESVEHETHQVGDRCPGCGRGKLYELKQAVQQLALMASSPIQAIRFLKQRLRCSGCQRIFVAKAPEQARHGKFHPSANAAVAISKYGLGVPFKRLEKWQKYMGIPLPDATQWEMVERVADSLYKIYKALERRAADCATFFGDDTNMPILSLLQENKTLGEKARYGMRATGILARDKGLDIYLYYLGRLHTGENLGELLDKRSPHLPDPLQMGDASSCNTRHNHNTVSCFCSGHAIRKFKTAAYPEYTDEILRLLKAVFDHDAKTRELDLGDAQRLAYHKKHSSPLIKELKDYFSSLLDKNLIEPNSDLRKAITYMTKRWDGFTRFLEIPGAPLDNNIIERALKLVIRTRKNAGFFKNEHGAFVASIIFSILATATAAGANPMDYLTAVQIHRGDAQCNPTLWFPWNYRDRLKKIEAA